ncbi:MAG: response regulator transcription factor [Planctomycetota bacterium]|nr:MAG: response regulator transcription factor [Planctomycetota bacterium]
MHITKVLVLTVHSDKRFVANALAAGASGYLLKNCTIDELMLAIQAVCENQINPFFAQGTAGETGFKADNIKDAAKTSETVSKDRQSAKTGK